MNSWSCCLFSFSVSHRRFCQFAVNSNVYPIPATAIPAISNVRTPGREANMCGDAALTAMTGERHRVIHMAWPTQATANVEGVVLILSNLASFPVTRILSKRYDPTNRGGQDIRDCRGFFEGLKLTCGSPY